MTQSIAEATKHRDFNKSDLVNPDMLKTAKSLKNHPNIIIRRADKSNVAIVLNKTDNKTRLDNIVQDSSKFKRITSYPINLLKVTVNKLIAMINKKNNSNKIVSPIVGEYSPGYIYGIVKIHKDNNPQWPITSQIPTPIYETSNQLNQIITKYLPAKYIINSTGIFVQLVPSGILASLDVLSLFTNVPIITTLGRV